MTAVGAANTLALQRMELFKEDSATAANVTKRPKGKGDASEASYVCKWSQSILYRLIKYAAT